MAQRSGAPHRKLRAIISECRADNSRNAARDQFGIPRAFKSECRARSPRNPHAFEFGGALGYDFGLIRTEIELAYSRARNNSLTLETVGGAAVPANALQDLVDAGIDTDVIDLTEVTNVQVSGNTVKYDNGSKLRRLSALANVWLDIPVGEIGISPYVGGGIGIQGSEIEGEGKATFAWQLGAGIAVPVGSSFAITADYRYRQQSGYTLNEDGFDYARIGKAKSSSFLLGLRAYF